MLEKVRAADVQTGRVLCMPSLTGRPRAIVAHKRYGVDPAEPESTHTVLMVGVYPPRGENELVWFVLHPDAPLLVDKPRANE